MEPGGFVHGHIMYGKDEEGFSTFNRFFPSQLDVFCQNGIYAAAASSSAGIYFGFMTDGSRVEIECRPGKFLRMLLPIIKDMGADQFKNAASMAKNRDKGMKTIDGIDLVLDGEWVQTVKPRKGVIAFDLDNPEHLWREVRLYLPTILPVSFRNLTVDGNIRPLDPEPRILCLGDSITQGFIAGSPSRCYVAQLAGALHAEAVNQGVSGYVYEPESLNGLENLAAPNLITVAYGTNDWNSEPDAENIQRNIIEYYKRLTALYPRTPIYSITPIWRADQEEERECKIPLSKIAEYIHEAVWSYPLITVIDGLALIPHDKYFYADGFLHPNAKGFLLMTEGLKERIPFRF